MICFFFPSTKTTASESNMNEFANKSAVECLHSLLSAVQMMGNLQDIIQINMSLYVVGIWYAHMPSLIETRHLSVYHVKIFCMRYGCIKSKSTL